MAPKQSATALQLTCGVLLGMDEDECARLPPPIVSIVLTALLSFANFGYATGVLSGGAPMIAKTFNLSTFGNDVTVTSGVAAAAIGAAFGGSFGDACGRKPAICSSAGLCAVATLFSALAPTWLLLVISRCVLGFGVGLSFTVVPLYVAECVPASMRGRVIDLSDFAIVFGQLCSGLINGGTHSVVGKYMNDPWRVSLGLGAPLPAAMLVCMWRRCPESPRWLLRFGQRKEALEVFTSLNGVVEGVNGGFQAIEQTCSAEDQVSDVCSPCGPGPSTFEPTEPLAEQSVNFDEPVLPLAQNKWRSAHVVRALAVGVGLQALNQLSGINTAMYYGASILISAGFKDSQAIWLSCALTLAQLCGVCLSLSTIDSRGRRFTALRSVACTIPSLAVLGLAFALDNSWLAVSSLLCYLVAFGSGLSGVAYVVTSEIYPLEIRARCCAIGGSVYWSANFIISLAYPLIAANVGAQYAFWFFGAVSLVGFYLIWHYLPETAHKSLEEINKFFTAEPYPMPQWAAESHAAVFGGATGVTMQSPLSPHSATAGLA